MQLLELQILFQQKIEDVNPVFAIDQRPNTYTIINYLNRAIRDYLKKGFMTLPTFEQQLVAVNQNQDNLRYLIRTDDVLEFPWTMTVNNWGTRAKRYRLPDDMLIPLSLSTTITREEVQAYTGQKEFVQWTNRMQAEKIIKTTHDQVIHIRPVAFIEDEFYVVVVGDSYVTSITADRLTYLRKPDTLSWTYTEIEGSLASPDVSVMPVGVGTVLRALTPLQYVDYLGNATNYLAGERFTKISGYSNVFARNSEPVKISYPAGNTNTPDFPEHMHEDLLVRATQLFLEEAKLKLVPTENN